MNAICMPNFDSGLEKSVIFLNICGPKKHGNYSNHKQSIEDWSKAFPQSTFLTFLYISKQFITNICQVKCATIPAILAILVIYFIF